MITPGQLVCEFATIPSDILDGKNSHTLVSSMFLHGGFMHLAGNMLYLWIFGDNIEAKIGSFKFLAIYLISGYAASAAHVFLGGGGQDIINCRDVCGIDPCDLSGNISPCLGSIPSLGASGAISGVAWWAHFGGFLIGILAGLFSETRSELTHMQFQLDTLLAR
jgi:membrane associated rhomboid family serine protease